MKLGKLLAAGKSIMNGRTDVSYRSSKQIYLPKFGSAKNPFKSESVGHSSEAATATVAPEPCVSAGGSETVAAAVASARAASVSAASSDAISGVRAVSVGIAESPRPVSRPNASTFLPRHSDLPRQSAATAAHRFTPSAPSAAAVQTVRIPQLPKFNPFSILRNALPGGRAKDSARITKGQKLTPTQTELSLDTVRVVHNDLSDVDVEVVPIKSRLAATEMPAPKKSWEFVGERLFGVEAT